MSSSAPARKKKATATSPPAGMRQMAAAEFKAKILSLIDEVNATGVSVVVTKRGHPKAALVPYPATKGVSLLGRLEGKYAIHGDLLEPVFPLEDYDMLK